MFEKEKTTFDKMIDRIEWPEMHEHIPTRKDEPFDFWLCVIVGAMALLALFLYFTSAMVALTGFLATGVVAIYPLHLAYKHFWNKK